MYIGIKLHSRPYYVVYSTPYVVTYEFLSQSHLRCFTLNASSVLRSWEISLRCQDLLYLLWLTFADVWWGVWSYPSSRSSNWSRFRPSFNNCAAQLWGSPWSSHWHGELTCFASMLLLEVIYRSFSSGASSLRRMCCWMSSFGLWW